MEYFSEQFFRDIRNNLSDYTRKAELNRYYQASEYTQFDIFLSYNIKDKEIVEGIYHYLTRQGKKVYLDFIVDPDMHRDNASVTTARKIRNRIRNSTQLIYAISCNSAESKWMPWELGVADGMNHTCYVMPVTNYCHKDFQQKEYLQLYPILEKQMVGYYNSQPQMVYKNTYGTIYKY